MSGWVCIQGASVAGPCEVTKGRMKGRSLVGAVIGYSRHRVIQCQRLETVDSEDDVQPAPRGTNKVLKCLADVTVS